MTVRIKDETPAIKAAVAKSMPTTAVDNPEIALTREAAVEATIIALGAAGFIQPEGGVTGDHQRACEETQQRMHDMTDLFGALFTPHPSA